MDASADKKYNIICFGFLPWSNMWKRNQSMMAEMSRSEFINRVIFVNPLISIRKFINKSDNQSDRVVYHQKLVPSHISHNLVVYTPLNILPYKRCLYPLKKTGIRIILNIIRRLNADKPYILFMNCPNIFSQELLDILLEHSALSVFDFSDDFSELNLNPETTKEYERNISKYASAANIVLTVNDHIKNKYAYLNSNIHVLRNATNYNNFDRQEYKRVDILEKIRDGNKPIIGYSGLANLSRIDNDLLDFLMHERQDWQFVFVGPVKPNFLERYSSKNNFHFIPPVNYEMLPDYIRYFDAAIVPFKINEHTRGNDLLKLHDYLAMGKPVITTDIGGAKDLGHVVNISSDKYVFLENIEKALSGDSAEEKLKRKQVAYHNSWHVRIKELYDLINGMVICN